MTKTTTPEQGTKSRRSYSQLYTLRQCGEAYRLQYIEKVPAKPSLPMLAGTIIHTITEAIDRLIERGAQAEEIEESISREVDEVRERVVPTGRHFGKQDWDWWTYKGIPNSLTAYHDWRAKNAHLETFTLPNGKSSIEVLLDWNVENFRVKGYIDRVFRDRNSGSYLILDIKSGLKPKTDEQLGLYYLGLKELGVDAHWGRYIYDLKSGLAKDTPAFDLRRFDDGDFLAQMTIADAMVNAGYFLAAPGAACFLCTVSDYCTLTKALI